MSKSRSPLLCNKRLLNILWQYPKWQLLSSLWHCIMQVLCFLQMQRFIKWLRKADDTSLYTTTVCTGAVLAGYSGEGFYQALQLDFPHCTLPCSQSIPSRLGHRVLVCSCFASIYLLNRANISHFCRAGMNNLL